MPSIIFKSKSKSNLQGSTTLDPISEKPDNNLTALPAPTSTDHQNPKEGKKSQWRRRLTKLKDRTMEILTLKPRPLKIGKPTEFRHVLSGTHKGVGTDDDFVEAFGLEVCEREKFGPFKLQEDESEWEDF